MPLNDSTAIEYGFVREYISKALSGISFTDSDNLVSLGLDSLKVMRLVGLCRKAGLKIVFADMIAEPTMAAWMKRISEASGNLAAAYSQAVVDGSCSGGACIPSPCQEARLGGNLDAECSAPFALTDVQQAYWIGRQQGMPLGGTGCHAYIEANGHDVDPARLACAWETVLRHHPMLRAVFLENGMQQVRPEQGSGSLVVHDLSGMSLGDAESFMLERRRVLSHRKLDIQSGHLAGLELCLLADGCTRLLFDIDLLVADVQSFCIVLRDLASVYAGGKLSDDAAAFSFSSFLDAKRVRDSNEVKADASWWAGRLAGLPGAPALPLKVNPSDMSGSIYRRREFFLSAERWKALKHLAAAHESTPAMVLLAAFCEVIGRWSSKSRFLVNLPLFDRVAGEEGIEDAVADFTNLLLVDADCTERLSFSDRLNSVRSRFNENSSHSAYSGVQVQRDYLKIHPEERFAAPVVFACNIGSQLLSEEFEKNLGTFGYMISQTPQVWLDSQIYETHDGRLVLAWDAPDGLFEDGVLDDMLESNGHMLERLADVPSSWDEHPDLLPEGQKAARIVYNDTECPIEEVTLDILLKRQVARSPQAPAVITNARTLNYAELFARACAVSEALISAGSTKGCRAGIIMDKGWEQAVACAGCALGGIAYVPVDVNMPEARLAEIFKEAEISVVLTQTGVVGNVTLPEGIHILCVDSIGMSDDLRLLQGPSPDDLAYIIYTSGSTGKPKGVAINHIGVVNTVLDINERFDVGSSDRTFGISALNFDLSVYDLWGAWAAGGAVVLPEPGYAKDPSRWLELIRHHGVTVWNSVPMIMQMLVEHMEISNYGTFEGMRIIMLSGDWIPLDLPARIRRVFSDVRLYSLGGATEASIWSIVHPIKEISPAWKSVPYGKPLRNQKFFVLNKSFDDCPDEVSGDLYIGGRGLALCYWNNPGKTAEAFIIHPATGERIYRTGDVGLMRRDGNIEFLGRSDFQVKIRGHRIELGEIESVASSHPSVRDAVAVVAGSNAADKRIILYVSVVSGIHNQLEDNSILKELLQLLSRHLANYMMPASVHIIEAMPLTSNGKVDRKALVVMAEAHSKSSPRRDVMDDMERKVAALWANVLERDDFGVADNFFDAGGTSVLAVRLHAAACGATGLNLPVVCVFENPTVRTLSAYIAKFGSTDERASSEVSQQSERISKRRARRNRCRQ